MGGNLTPDEIKECTSHEKHKNIKHFVETGTYHADTTLEAAKCFENVYTVEIVENLFRKCVERAGGSAPSDMLLTNTVIQVGNISFTYGDSLDMLREVSPQVKDGAVFFIDAHQSGPDTGNNGKWVPLVEELDIILAAGVGPSVFIFDDVRLWKKKCWDWAHVTNTGILGQFEKAGYKVLKSYEKNDRFYVLTE